MKRDTPLEEVEDLATRLAVAKEHMRELEREFQHRSEAESKGTGQLGKQRVQAVLDDTTDGMWEWDIATGDVYYSPRWEELFGYREGSAARSLDTLLALVHPGDFDDMSAEIHRYLKREIPSFCCEYRMFKLDGTPMWIQHRATVFLDEDGKPLQIVGFVIDKTARQQATESMRLSERSLKIIVENTPGIIYWADIEWTPKLINSGQGLCGYTNEELTQEAGGWLPLVIQDDRERIQREWELLIQAPASLVQTYRILDKSGKARWVEDRKASFFSREGRFLYIEGVISDVHERKSAESDLRRTKEMLEQTNQMARVGGWELDFRNDRLLWSEVTKEIHEVPPDYEPELETAINFYKEGENREKISEMLRRAIEDGVPWDVELQLVTQMGREIWVRAIGQADFVSGTCVRCYGTFQDIDLRKKNEEDLARARQLAELANQAKTDFLANMSHEIRTPMNAVLGLVELVRKTELSPLQEDYVSKLFSSSRALLAILNDVLDLSKIEANQLLLDPRGYAVCEIDDRVSSLFGDLALQKDLQLNFTVSDQVPKMILGDVDRVAQVLNNLVGNAIKFTEQGRVDVAIDVAEHLEDNLLLRFSVSDTGIGIPESHIQDVFKAFVQGDASRSRRFGGTGLGLSICKRLVELMGGSIKVESELGAGSVFVFTIRCRALNDNDHPLSKHRFAGQSTSSTEASRIEGARILLVEDNDVNRLVACAFIERAGCAVETANNGSEAIDRVREAPYDAVLMDIQMPDMNGYEATRRIHALPGLERLPVIAVTASAMEADRQACRDAGMVDFLSKPVDSDRLIEVLRACLEPGPKN